MYIHKHSSRLGLARKKDHAKPCRASKRSGQLTSNGACALHLGRIVCIIAYQSVSVSVPVPVFVTKSHIASLSISLRVSLFLVFNLICCLNIRTDIQDAHPDVCFDTPSQLNPSCARPQHPAPCSRPRMFSRGAP